MPTSIIHIEVKVHVQGIGMSTQILSLRQRTDRKGAWIKALLSSGPYNLSAWLQLFLGRINVSSSHEIHI